MYCGIYFPLPCVLVLQLIHLAETHVLIIFKWSLLELQFEGTKARRPPLAVPDSCEPPSDFSELLKTTNSPGLPGGVVTHYGKNSCRGLQLSLCLYILPGPCHKKQKQRWCVHTFSLGLVIPPLGTFKLKKVRKYSGRKDSTGSFHYLSAFIYLCLM